jgi:hypothetical protein
MKMNNQPPLGPVPLIGQHPSEEQVLGNLYRTLYFQLIPVVTAKFLDRETLNDPLLDSEPTCIEKDIAAQAKRIAVAAMAAMGVTINDR